MTTTVSISTDDLAVAAKLIAVLSGAAEATIPPPVTNSFPTDPTQAPSPSPEGSEIALFQGKIVGAPYLKDGNNSIHTLSVAADGLTTTYAVNGVAHASTAPAVLLLVRQGAIFIQIASGQWQQFSPSMGSIYNVALPAASTPDPAGGTPIPAPPSLTLPTASTIAPGGSGRVIDCGQGQTLASLSAALPTAQAGDTIRLAPGTYGDTPPAWTVPLLIDLGGATFTATTTANLARGKGLLVPCADSIIQNGTILGVAADQTEGQLTCAIRPDGGCGYLTIKNMVMHGNQCAVGEGTIGNCVIELDTCDISDNGLKVNTGALTHDLYVGADCVRLTLTNVVANGAVEGYAIKYRGPQLIVNGGTFASAPGKPFDLPNGGAVPFTITGATIIKNVHDADHGILAYGEEGATNGLAGGVINGGTINAACPNPLISGSGGTITLAGVTLTGNPITATAGMTLAVHPTVI